MPMRGRGQRKVEYWKYRFFYVRGGRAIRVLVLPNCSVTPPALLPSCAHLRRHSSMPQKRKRTVDCRVPILFTRHQPVLPTGSATTYGCGPNADSDNCQCRPIFKMRPAHRDPPPTEAWDRTQATKTARAAPALGTVHRDPKGPKARQPQLSAPPSTSR